MTRTTEKIERDIADHRERLADLQGELHQARQTEAVKLAVGERRRKTMQSVLERLKAGEWVAGHGSRLWWCRKEKAPIQQATSDEVEALDAMAAFGIVDRGAGREC